MPTLEMQMTTLSIDSMAVVLSALSAQQAEYKAMRATIVQVGGAQQDVDYWDEQVRRCDVAASEVIAFATVAV